MGTLDRFRIFPSRSLCRALLQKWSSLVNKIQFQSISVVL